VILSLIGADGSGSRTAKDAKVQTQDKGGGLGVELGALGGKAVDLPVPAN
jgi:hypothetical protein